MTAPPNPGPDHMRRPNPECDTPARQGDPILPTRDVPIAVWRLDDRDDTGLLAGPRDRLAARLAQRLVRLYTRRGDAIVDLDSHPQLHAISTGAGRAYLSISDPGEIADLDRFTAPVSLVVLRWPPRHRPHTPAGITDLFAACRLIMTADSCAVAAVSSAEPGQDGTTYAEHLSELLPGAHAAGLTHILQIVAVTGPGHGDQFLYYATTDEAEAARHAWPTGGGAPSHHVELLVFTTGKSCDD
jgi:hypothetical protein